MGSYLVSIIFGKMSQEDDHKSEVSLGYIVKHYLKKRFGVREEKERKLHAPCLFISHHFSVYFLITKIISYKTTAPIFRFRKFNIYIPSLLFYFGQLA